MALPRYARSLLLAILTVSALFSAAAPSSADTLSVRAVRLEGSSLVFKLRSVRPLTVTGARLRVGGFQRHLSGRKVRRGTRRGVLRVGLPKRVRRTMKAAARSTAGRSSPVVVTQARLVVTTGDAGTDPRKSCPVPQDANYVSPSGSDTSPGTADQPWRTLDKAEAESRPGMTVVLRGGTYSARGHVTYIDANGSPSAPISWIAAVHETPVIHGAVGIGGNNRHFCGLLFEGPTGPTADPAPADDPEREQDKIYVSGDDVEISNSEVTGSRWHSGIYLAEAARFRIIDNYIHDNGQFGVPSHANLDHGIYVGEGSGLIEGNRIEHNVAHAVQLYPLANGVTVRNNVMSRHGRAAVMIGENAANNQVVDNRISGNRKGVQAYALSGRGNVVRSNHLEDNREGNLVDLEGVSVSSNDSR